MPISYTKRGWTNNSPPAINAANLGAMDDGLKLAVDALNTMGDAGQQAVKEIGEAPASTTGGKLVNKITEAGYSLAPATGTSNLDNIADGTSYKRIQAAKADALNSSTIVAGTIWSSGNDGNGGQPPAPKPRVSIGNIGHFAKVWSGVDAGLAAPPGGKWAYWAVKITNNKLWYDDAGGVITGGTAIFSADSGYQSTGWFWRIE